ncbi:hypothetical protein HMPREF0454_04191 [Hafnia alvei ATCC 51873]|uniref:Uncharacterized protein n=1 Tax=Hafnia alvei ATCC 51873 TaxID=1002364 RepID=G9YBT2_HAFAL|nr:hypothetical protein HMPREF0454_04191 [Hafnia alvei ATCC 51873]
MSSNICGTAWAEFEAVVDKMSLLAFSQRNKKLSMSDIAKRMPAMCHGRLIYVGHSEESPQNAG